MEVFYAAMGMGKCHAGHAMRHAPKLQEQLQGMLVPLQQRHVTRITHPTLP